MPIFGVTAFQGVQNIVTIDPEKSRDFSFKNPGILVDVKSRDPGIPGIPLGPDPEMIDKILEADCIVSMAEVARTLERNIFSFVSPDTGQQLTRV